MGVNLFGTHEKRPYRSEKGRYYRPPTGMERTCSKQLILSSTLLRTRVPVQLLLTFCSSDASPISPTPAIPPTYARTFPRAAPSYVAVRTHPPPPTPASLLCTHARARAAPSYVAVRVHPLSPTPASRAYHLFVAMVKVHYVRDKGNYADQWLMWPDWLRVKVRVRVRARSDLFCKMHWCA